MAGTSDIAALLRVPGRLCINPTTLTGAFPGNGTSLGLIRQIRAAPNRRTKIVTEEGFGVTVAFDGIDQGESWGLAAILRAADQGVMQNFTLASKVGASTGETMIVSPGAGNSPAGQPGGWLGARAVKLVFWPNDPKQWFLYFPRALPRLDLQAEIDKSIRSEFGAAVVFSAVPPLDGGATLESVQWGPREDIVL